MGRKKKYLNDEEKNEAKKVWWMNYYIKNKEIVKEKNKNRYHVNKNKPQEDC
jgi:hypothetical protein